MVHFARLTCLQHHADRGTQAIADEMVVYGRAREQRGNRDAVGAGFAIRQDDNVAAVSHFFLGPLAQFVERPAHAVGAMLCRESDVERARLEVIAAHL